jgi:hypothetical protein
MADRRARPLLRPVSLTEAVYKGIQVTMEKFGDFLRELAVLVLVFIPLDLWQKDITWMRSIGVLALSALFFVSGVVCEFVAIAVKRERDKYEEEQSCGPDPST